MKAMTLAVRLSVGLACLSLSVLFLALMTGVMPDGKAAGTEGRRALGEETAARCAPAATAGDLAAIEAAARDALRHDPDLIAVTVVRADGSPVVAVSASRSRQARAARGADLIRVPIFRGTAIWGSVELWSRQPGGHGLWLLARSPEIRFITFFSVLSFCFQILYLWSLLEPSRAGSAAGRT